MFGKSDLLTLETIIYSWIFVGINAGAKVAIILLACRPCVVIVGYWDMIVPWVELPVQRRLCPIFVSGVGLSDIYEYSAG